MKETVDLQASALVGLHHVLLEGPAAKRSKPGQR